ncbi:MAG: helix-turn-helix domain-containing protein [Muribaculaceae bacterium]|jgi:AraC-type DNA-binding domain-containing proteins|nr:helix-turn-helix domain-containing protein [Muribaculaceae bacterium]
MEEYNTMKVLEQTATEYSNFDDKMTFIHLGNGISGQLFDRTDKTFKIEGLVILLVTKGSVTFTYNFNEYKIESQSVVVLPAETIISAKPDNIDNLEAYILGFKPSFLQEINLSFSVISNKNLIEQDNPILEISENSSRLLLRYFSLIWTAMGDQENLHVTKHILSSLSSALFYQILLLVYKSIDSPEATTNIGPGRRSYVRDFFKLVHLNYTSERSVSFYASKLFISPKYLSLLVKEATGKSAAYWIDRFVINEAKNLLRYSGKNIQQVAYSLNFSNQSSFGKYFKHLTGMSPTEFQKS